MRAGEGVVLVLPHEDSQCPAGTEDLGVRWDLRYCESDAPAQVLLLTKNAEGARVADLDDGEACPAGWDLIHRDGPFAHCLQFQ